MDKRRYWLTTALLVGAGLVVALAVSGDLRAARPCHRYLLADTDGGQEEESDPYGELWQTCSRIHRPERVQRNPQTPSQNPIQSLHILGERHSGTNAMEGLLQINFNLPVKLGITSHKHWMQRTPADGESLDGKLAVLVVRNPYDWIAGMFDFCWHCFRLQQLPFEEFVRAAVPRLGKLSPPDNPWDVNLWERNTSSMSSNSSVPDGYPDAFAEFSSLLEMRRLKVCQAVQFVRQHGGHLEVVRQEDIMHPHNQVELARRLQRKYHLPLFGTDKSGRVALAQRLKEHYGMEAEVASRLAAGSGGSAVLRAWQQYKGGGGSEVEYDPNSKLRESLYFKGGLQVLPAEWQPRVQLLNTLLDWRLESALGYTPVLSLDSAGGDSQ